MRFLKRFKRDPLNLVGPDVARAPLRTIDLSGTKVAFRCPPQTEAIPLFGGQDSFDIYRDVEPDAHDPTSGYLTVFSSGWVLNDRPWWGLAYGGIAVDIILGHYNAPANSSDSLFSLDTLRKWLCDITEMSYGRSNRKKWENRDNYVTPVTPELSFWRYPKTKEDIKTETVNGILWCIYEMYQPGHPPRRVFETAIGHRHSLSFSFSASAYGGIDYFSPEHNVKQASEALIREIMSTVTIQLSPQAQREFDEMGSRLVNNVSGEMGQGRA